MPIQLSFNTGTIPIRHYLAFVFRLSSFGEWVTAQRAKDTPPWIKSTGSMAYDAFEEAIKGNGTPPMKEELALADDLLAWFRERAAVTNLLSSYETKLLRVLLKRLISRNETCLAASAVPIYITYSTLHQKRETAHESIGQRFDLTVALRSTVEQSTKYGIYYCHSFIDSSFNYIWKTTKPLSPGIYTGRGTVQKRTISMGIGATVLTRCSLKRVLSKLPDDVIMFH